ncbi:phenylacetic acid degradation operon negative regulatory protein [Citricoccus zhacaiensis]|uniref:Phenylacetic acid degradation operon negative regulatory protein n=1 Tax=Citricoccus zhacaiensis TaxID=489142 RepID=A0ABQ2LVH6_9MICC|nr:PaaX family transcriptional regulator C-terminal domain-containing protein [Citricoccus zhacaiensis]GGO43689.1 phenylacetic acid degradation operon negative regulatory protein [Citricoccus zhacaiensis]
MNSSTRTDAGTRRSARPPSGLTRGSARSELMTILGELVWTSGQPARTSALLYVMGGLGIEEATARQAIIRASDSGWIQGEKFGREVEWSPTPYLSKVFSDGLHLVDDLSNPFTDWDSQWLTLFITVPQAQRSQRQRLYTGLSQTGMGNPLPGVWLTPHVDRHDQVKSLVERLELTGSIVALHGPVDPIGLTPPEIVSRGWDLDSLAAEYRAVLDEFGDADPVDDDEVLFTEIRSMGRIQGFTFTDPQLPEALLPGWIGREVAAHIMSLRRRWSATVKTRWSEINER